MTPEMLKGDSHDFTIDWYGFGVLLYECIVSIPPYFCTDEQKLHQNILEAPLKIPSDLFSPDCEDLVRRLLHRNPQERLGAVSGFNEIRDHPWFAEVDWDEVYTKLAYVPIYSDKTLKQRQNRVHMDSLLPSSQEKGALKI